MSEVPPPPPAYPPFPPPPYPPPRSGLPDRRRHRPRGGVLLRWCWPSSLRCWCWWPRSQCRTSVADARDDVASEVPWTSARSKTYDDLDATHTADDVDYPQIAARRRPARRRCGSTAAPTTSRSPTRTPSTTSSTGRSGSPMTLTSATDDVAALEDAAPAERHPVAVHGLRAPVVVTVWGRQLALDGADDPRLPLFIETFGGGETAPEPYASCAGGVTDPDTGAGTDV